MKSNTQEASKNAPRGYARAKLRIPGWAHHTEYMCSRIIRAFFEVANANDVALYGNIRQRCSDRLGSPETYVA